MKNIRLLIVEDEIAIANLIKNLIDFDRLNLDFIGIALNGQQALNLARQEHPDIVITDISMPGMNGLQLIDEIQKQEFLTHFIIISGHDTVSICPFCPQNGSRRLSSQAN